MPLFWEGTIDDPYVLDYWRLDFLAGVMLILVSVLTVDVDILS